MSESAPPLILASGSPRRKEILEAHGVSCVVVISEIDEEPLIARWKAGEKDDVGALVMALAQAKARAVFALTANPDPQSTELMGGRPLSTSAPVLAADTLVYDDERGTILGKPKTSEEALRMLMALSGRSHEVYTGVALIDTQGNETVFYDRSKVSFDSYNEQAARSYVDTGEPLDKAGAYAIQGLWGTHVTSIEGDYENIVGLPWYRLKPQLTSFT